MANTTSNRSPSPIATPRPNNLNPNSRNQENNPATRKSVSGNNPFGKPWLLTNLRRFDPVTPANSPSDFSRRSVEKESCVASSLNICEEKENDEKDMNSKAATLGSPAKNPKNFMSPTISAASKFTPSRRKKVLVERNDPVRCSMSLSDGKAMFFSTSSSIDVSEDSERKCDLGFDQNHYIDSFVDSKVAESMENEAVPEDPAVFKPLKKVTFSDAPMDSESVTNDQDEILSESSFKNKTSCSDVSPSIAPLDADPSLPPYDPKTNYLSPRPQFLYYKPNPRIELLLSKNGLDSDELVRLEHAFATEDAVSEIVSDSEGTGESQVQDLQEEEPGLTASADMVVGVTETEELSTGIELPESSPVSMEISEDSAKKIDKKQWGFSRLMCGSMFLVFLIAFASVYVADSPLADRFILKNSRFSDFSDVYHQFKENLDWVAGYINQFRDDSWSFISELIIKLRDGEKLGPLQFMNLTDLQKKIWNEEPFWRIRQEFLEDLEDFEEEEEYAVDSEDIFDKEILEEAFDEKEYGGDSGETFDRDILEVDGSETEETSHYFEVQSELEPKISENVPSENGFASQDDQSAATSQDQESNFEAKNVEVEPEPEPEPEINDTENSNAESNLASSSDADADTLNDERSFKDDSLRKETVQSSTLLDSPPRTSHETFPMNYFVGISSIFVALSTVAGLVYLNKKKPSPAHVVLQKDPLLVKNTGSEFIAKHYIPQERLSTHSEVDLLGGSCPSGISSFQKNYKDLKGATEVQSVEKKPKRYSKRESLASSSEYPTGSPSYGSFTTFERIPTKQANRDEDIEVITPVRRSSRIRNQVTSP